MRFLPVLALIAAPAMAEDLVPPEVLALEGDAAYGEYLGGECTSCHKPGGAEGIPDIYALDRESFVLAMHSYKAGVWEHEVMQMMASRLGNEEIAALAAYFEGLR